MVNNSLVNNSLGNWELLLFHHEEFESAIVLEIINKPDI